MSEQLTLSFEDHNPEQKLICLDIECTGFDREKDTIIEVAAVVFDVNQTYETYHSLIHTNKEIPIIVADLTGINNSMLEGQPTLESQKQKILEFCKNYPIVGHNINFDLDFLDAKGIKVPGTRIDTQPMSEIFMPHVISHSLEILSHRFVDHQPTHRALDDVLANIELFQYMYTLWCERKSELSEKILAKSAVPWKKFFLNNTPPLPARNIKPEISTKPQLPQALTHDLQEIKPDIIVGDNEIVRALIQEDNIIELPSYYKILSPQKVGQLIEKPELTENEGIVGLKITLSPQYQKGNQTITTDNIKVGRNEYKLIQQLSENEPIIPADISSHEGPLTISHSYFFRLLNYSSQPEIRDLLNKQVLFCNGPFLEETYIRSQTETIHYNNFGTGIADMAFGLLGIFWNNEKKEDKSDTLIIKPEHLTSQNWQKVVEAFQHIDVQLPNLQTHHIWLKDQRNNPPFIQYIPHNLEYSLTNLTKELPEILIKQYHEHSNKTLVIDHALPKPSDPTYNNDLLRRLTQYLDKYTKDVCIVTTSHQQIKTTFKYLLKKYPDRNCIAQGLSGSAGKLMHKISEYEDHNILLCTYQFYLKHKPQFDNADAIIFAKLPMSSPNHPYFDIKKAQDNNFFSNYVIPQSALNLLHAVQVAQNNPLHVLLDKRLETERYGRNIQELLKDNLVFSNNETFS